MPIIDLTTTTSCNGTPTTPTNASNTAAVDIVAVHGLLEGGLQTWTDPASGVLWLRDMFPFQQCNARVLTYEYDAGALCSPSDGSADRLSPFVTNLVAELCADRQLVGASTRPIIFICHGLGGLLVKRALSYSSTRRDPKILHLTSIFVSTYAILFLATPHDGVRKESLLWSYQLNGQESTGPSQFVLNLVKGSEMLQEITDQFAPLVKRFAIYNIWEQEKTIFGERKAYVVEEASAAPPWDNAERCGISATHKGLAKFLKRNHQGYRILLEALTRYVKDAPALVEYRWEKHLDNRENDRQKEAEDLLKPQLQDILSNGQSPDRNEWFLVPRCSSTYFTGRQMHADSVREKLGPTRRKKGASRHQILVIYGLGGAGKTQFCLRYVEENRSCYWGIFWIDASNEENAESGFASIGQHVGKGATFATGMHWLSQCTKQWLLVIDNADDPDMDVSRYFPVGGSGHILITTRNPGLNIHATAGQIRFSGMDPEEGANLLLKTAFPSSELNAPSTENRQIARRIASELGYLALALAHAGTTVRRNIYTLEKYLHYYLGYRRQMLPVFKSVDEANIITTWEIPFRKIASRTTQECKDAVYIFHMFAFMHFESIPEAIFRRSWNSIDNRRLPIILTTLADGASRWSEESQARLRAALSVLCDYSIIDHDSVKGVISLHPVVRRWAQDRLSNEEQENWLSASMALLAHCISSNMEPSGRKFRHLLLPHIDACLQALLSVYGTARASTIERASEIERFAMVFAENGLWERARRYQTDVLAFRMKKLGRQNPHTVRAQRHLAQTEWNLFDVKPAIIMQLKILGTCWWSRPTLGDWLTWPPWLPEHVPYCVTLSDLTLSLWLAGRRERSKQVGERAVNGLIKRLGPDDPLTLTAMFNLGRTYLHLGNYDTCRNLLVEVLRKRKRLFGCEHPDTLMSRNELGMCLCAQKRHLAVAERLVTNVLAARKRILGEEHAYTLWSMNDLAKVLYTRRRADAAIRILEDVVPIVIRTLGARHVGMTMTKSNLALAYVSAKRWSDAEAMLQDLLRDVPEDHPDRIHIMSGYVYVKTETGRLDEAESDCLQLLEVITRQKLLPLHSPRKLAVVKQLAIVYHRKRRVEDLETLLAKYPCISLPDKLEFNPWHV